MFSTWYGLWKIKDIAERTQSDKALKDKAFKIASDPKPDGYHKGLVLIIYKFFDEKSSESGVANESNYQLASEIYKQIIKWAKATKESSIYCVQLNCLVNTHELFL